MIAEPAPQGYRTGAGSKSCVFKNDPGPADAATVWSEWYAGYFGLIAGNRDVIRAAMSVFAHEVCLPVYDNGYRYNGTPPDTGVRPGPRGAGGRAGQRPTLRGRSRCGRQRA